MKEKQVILREESVTINYLTDGKGDTTLLFLHGWCINSAYWKSQLDYFSPRFEVVAIDLPGFGKSMAERDNWTIEEYSKDVIAFIDALDLNNVVIIGHSMAGDIMLQTVLTYDPRIAGIVGIDNFKYIDVEFTPEQMKQFNEFFIMLKKDFINSAPAYAEMTLFHQSTSMEVKERVKSDFASADAQIGYNSLLNCTQYLTTEAQKFEKLDIHLYLINSDYFPTNEIGLENHCNRGYSILTISESGHYPMIEKPEEFNRLLEEILSKNQW